MSRFSRSFWTRVLILVLAAPAIIFPAGCLFYIIMQGIGAWEWSMFSIGGNQKSFGMSSGIWPQITGSLILMLGANMLALPVATGLALYHQLSATTRQRILMQVLLQLMQGIPPIVYGLCGLVVLVYMMHWGVSVLAGQVILAVVILPLLVLNTVHAIERVDRGRTEAAKSLGLSHTAIIRRVWLPETWPALLTGLLLGMARALSETAPILFTATVFSGVVWPDSLFSPVTSLQSHIFYLAQEGGNDQARGMAWVSAIILITLISTLSIAATMLRRMEVTHEHRF
ncbi:MAG: ABC transporter permease subunit [Mariprofundus sp.]|nr:ABC transporter permease subunit [Mariprofundus sp.]